jgi:hypothetical protein
VTDIELHIDELAVRFDDCGTQHRHRVRPITRRALTLFQELAEGQLLRLGADPARLELALPASQVDADLSRDSDEVIARRIAEAWLTALSDLNR